MNPTVPQQRCCHTGAALTAPLPPRLAALQRGPGLTAVTAEMAAPTVSSAPADTWLRGHAEGAGGCAGGKDISACPHQSGGGGALDRARLPEHYASQQPLPHRLARSAWGRATSEAGAAERLRFPTGPAARWSRRESRGGLRCALGRVVRGAGDRASERPARQAAL